jgi:hypothetical protein
MRFFTPALLAAIFATGSAAIAQDYYAQPPQQPEQLQALPPLEQLLAPIALYPDPLIALMLPAAARPDQLQAVAAYPAGADDPNFDASIQGLAHYPDVLNWMAANLNWTQQLGSAFASAPGEVMNAVQSLRQRARAAGTLAPSNYEQIVVDADGQIEILPAQPETIYIPTYNPAVVYWAPPPGYYGSYFGWSRPYAIGAWLTFDFDWHRRALWYGDWYTYRRAHGGWNRPVDYAHVNLSATLGHGRAWRPPEHIAGSTVGRGSTRSFGRDGTVAQPAGRAEFRTENNPRPRPVLPQAERSQVQTHTSTAPNPDVRYGQAPGRNPGGYPSQAPHSAPTRESPAREQSARTGAAYPVVTPHTVHTVQPEREQMPLQHAQQQPQQSMQYNRQQQPQPIQQPAPERAQPPQQTFQHNRQQPPPPVQRQSPERTQQQQQHVQQQPQQHVQQQQHSQPPPAQQQPRPAEQPAGRPATDERRHDEPRDR